MSTLVLDEKDLEILEFLLKDSRTRLSVIAEQINVSIPTVTARIDKMVALGIITRFTLELNMDLLSEYPAYFIPIQIEPKFVEKVIEDICKDPLIEEAYELSYNYQVILKTAHISTFDFNQLIQRLRQYSGVKNIEGWVINQTSRVNPVGIPKKEVHVKITCEYCFKTINQDYRLVVIKDKPHYLCCDTCASAFKQEQGTMLEHSHTHSS